MNILKSIITLVLRYATVDANLECDGAKSIASKYYLIEKCQRSTLGVLAYAQVSSLSSCRRLGTSKKALSLNFSPPEANPPGDADVPEYNCEILTCSESEVGLSLVNDTRYDYYSMFARPMPNTNATCVPGVGMFMLFKRKLNYTQADEICRNRSGHLADVSSELRTDSLAHLLAAAGVDSAYIGMTSDNDTTFRTVKGDFLDCNTYRAWTPGHPKRHKKTKVYGCVTITRTRTWLTVTCDSRLPALCELISQGPYIIGSIEAAKIMNDTTRSQTPSNASISKNMT